MPTYAYECAKCSRVQDRNVPVDERDAYAECECGGPLNRVFSSNAQCTHVPYHMTAENDWTTNALGNKR